MDTNLAKKIIQQNKEVYNKIAAHFSNTRSYLWEDLKPLQEYTKNKNSIQEAKWK